MVEANAQIREQLDSMITEQCSICAKMSADEPNISMDESIAKNSKAPDEETPLASTRSALLANSTIQVHSSQTDEKVPIHLFHLNYHNFNNFMYL